MQMHFLSKAGLAAAVCVLGSVIACGGDEETPGEASSSSSSGGVDPDGSTSSSSSSGGSSGGSGSTSSGGSTSSSSGDGGGHASTYRRGVVAVSHRIEPDDSVSSSALARFLVSRSGSVCTDEQVGPCEVRECNGSAANDAGSVETQASAGVITIGAGGGALTLQPTAAGYPTAQQDAPLWTTENISVQAAGDEVPAFDVTLEPPSNVALLSPALGPSTPFAFPRTSDLAFEWTEGTTGGLAVTFEGAEGARRVSVGCYFPAEDGEGSVPTAVLERLPASGFYLVTPGTVQILDVEDWHLEVAAYYRARATGTFTAQ